MYSLSVMRLELLIARRNFWVATAVLLMALFTVVLTLAGGTSGSSFGVDPLTLAISSVTTLSVYLIPLIGLLLSFDAIAGERERGTLALSLSYPLSRADILLGKFLAHFLILAFAIAVGLALMVGLVVFQHGIAELAFSAVIWLFVTALALGATFLGLGYMASALVKQPSVASGMVILIWLVCVVLYDLGLLGALIADNGGYFTKTIFPWLLVANPADAFRLLNMPDSSVALLTSGLSAAGSVSGPVGQLTSLLLWPICTMLLSWAIFRRVEP